MFKIILYILLILATILPLLISMHIFTLVERKVMTYAQIRKGQNIMPFCAKLILESMVSSSKLNILLYIISPVLLFFLILYRWIFIINSNFCEDLIFGFLFLLVSSNLHILGMLYFASKNRSGLSKIFSYKVFFWLFLVSLVTGYFAFKFDFRGERADCLLLLYLLGIVSIVALEENDKIRFNIIFFARFFLVEFFVNACIFIVMHNYLA